MIRRGWYVATNQDGIKVPAGAGLTLGGWWWCPTAPGNPAIEQLPCGWTLGPRLDAYEALSEALQDAKNTLEVAAKILARDYPSLANNIVNQCAIRCGDTLAKARGETP